MRIGLGRRRGGPGAGREPDDVPTITSARPPLAEDVERRTTRYLISMGVRTACLILAVVVTGWLRWVFLAGAIFLPYAAVVLANAGRERVSTPDTVFDPRGITAGPETPARPETPAGPEEERDA